MTNTLSSQNGGATNRNGTVSTKRSDKGGRGGKTGGGRFDRNRKKAENKPENNNNNNNNWFKGQLQSGVLKGVVITDNPSKRPTQYDKMKDKLPSFCAEKGYDGLDRVIRDMKDWDESKRITRPDSSQWTEMIETKVAETDAGKPIMRTIPVVVDPELKEELLDEWRSKKKSEDTKWDKYKENKNSLITLIMGQLDEGTSNELELSPGYKKAIEDGDILNIIRNLRAICYGNYDGGLSYTPYKAVVAVKSLNNYQPPNKYTDPHVFKEEIKTKYQATLAMTGRFPNGTKFMEDALALNEEDDGTGKMVPKPLTIENYFAMPASQQRKWEKLGDDLNIAMIFLNNSRNENMKRDLRVAYSHGNKECYPRNVEALARLQATQYRVRDNRTTPNGGGGNGNTRRSNRSNDDKENEDPAEETAGQHMAGAHPSTANPNKNNTTKTKDEQEDNDDGNESDGGASMCHVIVSKPKRVQIQSIPKDRTAAEILGTHQADDPIWDTGDNNVSVDSYNSEEEMAGMYAGYANDTVNDDSDDESDQNKESSGSNLFSAYINASSSDEDNNENDNNKTKMDPNGEDRSYMFRNDGDDDGAFQEYLGEHGNITNDEEEQETDDDDNDSNTDTPHRKEEIGTNNTTSINPDAISTPSNNTQSINNKVNNNSKYYAVAHGRNPGIYDNWGVCLDQVHRFSGAVYRKCPTRAAAEQFINTYNNYQSSKERGNRTTNPQHTPNPRRGTTPPHTPNPYTTGARDRQTTQGNTQHVSGTRDISELHERELEQQAQRDLYSQHSLRDAQDHIGIPLQRGDLVRFLNDGGWNVREKIGIITKIGDGNGRQRWLTIQLDSFPLQNRLGRSVEFVSRPEVDLLTEGFSDFQLGQHRK